MIRVRHGSDRGFEDKGWLATHHTFSFDTYFDPNQQGFRALRVINEDTVQGGKGFGTHSHRDMEIITYVLEGVLEHRDSMGSTGVIRPGEMQLMSAGTGVSHSEYNLSHQIPVHFLQIWIYPDQNGLTPNYSQKAFSSASKWGKWCLMVSRNGRDGSLRIHQDVDLYASILDDGDDLIFETLVDRFYWVQVVSGKFIVQDEELQAGDGAALQNESMIQVKCLTSGEILLFDLA